MSLKRVTTKANHDLEALDAMVRALRKPYFDRSPAEVKELGLGPSVIDELLRRGEEIAGGDGFPRGGGGSRRGSDVADPTLGAVISTESYDAVGHALVELLGGLEEAVAAMIHADHARSFCLAVEGKAAGRVNTVEKCYLCGDPVVRDKVKRIDGKPYHATSCYFRERRKRQEAGVEWMDDAERWVIAAWSLLASWIGFTLVDLSPTTDGAGLLPECGKDLSA